MRILVFHPGALGDLILALPALSALRAKYPDAEITGLARYPVWRYFPLNIGYRDLETSGIHKLFSASDKEVIGPADLVISWMGAGNREFIDNIAESSGAEIISASPNPPEGYTRHASQYLLGALPSALTKLIPSPDDTETADRALREFGIRELASLLVIHPGSGARAKCWPALRFVEVACKWRSTRRPVLLLEGPADKRQAYEIISKLDVPVLKEASFGTLVSILSRCAVYLGNDSGITHLASVSGASSVALFGPTDPRVWGPLGAQVTIILSSADCAPCERSSWSNCEKGDCMTAIKTEAAWQAITNFAPHRR